MVIVCLAGIIASDGVDTQDQQVALVSDGLMIFANKSAMAKSGLTGTTLPSPPMTLRGRLIFQELIT